jgi:hypothetical protein
MDTKVEEEIKPLTTWFKKIKLKLENKPANDVEMKIFVWQTN